MEFPRNPPRPPGRRASRRGEIRAVVEGERVLGRFTVGERIGGGGHGTVHRAWDERLCRWVAVKAVEGALGRPGPARGARRGTAQPPGHRHPLRARPGRAAAPTWSASSSTDPNLRELAAAGGELSDRDVAEIGAELCAALAHAHAAGVVHRDLKPDNVLVRRRGGRFSRDSGERALLADFGIASVADAPSLTATGQVVGTLAYMSPEQATGDGAGPASDVYSLALTLYELWAGFNPVVQQHSRRDGAGDRRAGRRASASARPELPAGALRGDRRLPATPDPEQRPGARRAARGADRAARRPAPGPRRPRAARADLAATTLPPGLPARPFAVLLAAGGLAAGGDARRPAGAGDRRRGAARPRRAPALASLRMAPAGARSPARRDRCRPRLPRARRPAGADLRPRRRSPRSPGPGPASPPRSRAARSGSPAAGDASGWATCGPVAIDDVLAPLAQPRRDLGRR